MKWHAFLAISVAAITGCTSSNDTHRALEGAGYTDVDITGYRLFGCAREDQFHTGFSAIGPSGKRVTGVVCSGWLKGSTIRTD